MEANATQETETSLAPQQVAERLERGEIQVVDVRERSEWDAGHVPGARHVPIEEVPTQAESIGRQLPVVFQCRGGSRSEMVAAAFRESGSEAYNMEGGLRAWGEQGLPLEPPDGHIEGA